MRIMAAVVKLVNGPCLALAGGGGEGVAPSLACFPAWEVLDEGAGLVWLSGVGMDVVGGVADDDEDDVVVEGVDVVDDGDVDVDGNVVNDLGAITLIGDVVVDCIEDDGDELELCGNGNGGVGSVVEESGASVELAMDVGVTITSVIVSFGPVRGSVSKLSRSESRHRICMAGPTVTWAPFVLAVRDTPQTPPRKSLVSDVHTWPLEKQLAKTWTRCRFYP